MYLFPTEKELSALWRQINPTTRIMDYLCSRPPTEDSMAEFFMEGEDIELAMEDDCVDYETAEKFFNMKKVSWDEI
jgi:hypothetical protein